MLRIGEASAKYHISNRTLRYWEKEKILTSTRMENGYRYYDEESSARIKQIVLLRKLRVPVQDIEQIFKSAEMSTAIDVLTRHLENTKQETDALNALSIILDRMIQAMQSKQDLSELLNSLDIPNSQPDFEFKNSLQILLSERGVNMYKSTMSGPRIISLPIMTVASYRAESTSPEADCWAEINKLVFPYSLHLKSGFRHFGFNNPSPSTDSPVYGYEMQVTVPEDFVIPAPFAKKELQCGRYAAIPATMNMIGERWQELCDWAENNDKYALDNSRQCLEECLDVENFNSDDVSDDEKQLDLLIPIKPKNE